MRIISEINWRDTSNHLFACPTLIPGTLAEREIFPHDNSYPSVYIRLFLLGHGFRPTIFPVLLPWSALKEYIVLEVQKCGF